MRAIGRAAGWSGRLVSVPREGLPQGWSEHGNYAQHLSADTTRIRRELGYRESVSVEEGLTRTVAWERVHPPAPVLPEAFDYSAEDAVLAGLKRGE
ncbi:hypothetical protein [Limnochorda pilosa]|uniref:NAD-dependent epimerase/dehydratase n=1 Tax=Limnochorda pilosa TaxID=1555112 RepID=A0A0K2SH80_LIMPI|nr:hypothetical protein [Limnochorda pilosa]BAS26159.1 NAD-dependent epimerase/dehydratase [Limnochorda pilosa]